MIANNLTIVSNREPYSLRGDKVSRNVGGLVAAFEPLLKKSGGNWVAYGAGLEKNRKAPLKTAAMIVKAAQAAAPFLKKFDMEILMGKKVIEIRPRGASKGEAVRKLATASKAYRPVYFGDDATDEDAFRVRGVTGVKIGPGKSAARFRLAGPREALEALGRIRL